MPATRVTSTNVGTPKSPSHASSRAGGGLGSGGGGGGTKCSSGSAAAASSMRVGAVLDGVVGRVRSVGTAGHRR